MILIPISGKKLKLFVEICGMQAKWYFQRFLLLSPTARMAIILYREQILRQAGLLESIFSPSFIHYQLGDSSPFPCLPYYCLLRILKVRLESFSSFYLILFSFFTFAQLNMKHGLYKDVQRRSGLS